MTKFGSVREEYKKRMRATDVDKTLEQILETGLK